MILWGRASSVNVQKVLWALAELDLTYAHRTVGGKYGGLDDPAFAALTPVRKVPVLQDGDVAIWESHAILRHLARRTGRLGDPPGAVDSWMEFGSTALQPPFIAVFWQRVRLLPQDRSAGVEADSLAAIASALAMLDTGLSDGRAHLAGDAFTIADIAVGCLFHRLLDLYPDSLADTPHVAAWHARIAGRPHYRAWVAVSYDELRVQG
ncbi:glutathione S-transferase family protein [Loktanella sp. DJP18]|uniref:glutathione S-transferase family protein n=1 Tax=Loktanella sp. DJP18 TaxID=3409788 RepID=UPI003BB5AF05